MPVRTELERARAGALLRTARGGAGLVAAVSVVTMNDTTLRTFSVAALFVLGSFATGCAFDPNAAQADAEESENTETVQQAAIVFVDTKSAAVAPTCGSYDKGADGLCYKPCPAGYVGQVTRCIEACGIADGTCWRREYCTIPGFATGYACDRQYPAKFTDRGAGIPPSCALMGLAKGRDGKCYGLTGTGGAVSPPAAPSPSPPAAPTPTPVSDAANKCHHTYVGGQQMVWYQGRCLTPAEWNEIWKTITPHTEESYEELPCLLAGGCGSSSSGNIYSSPGNTTDHVTTNGHDLVGYGSP